MYGVSEFPVEPSLVSFPSLYARYARGHGGATHIGSLLVDSRRDVATRKSYLPLHTALAAPTLPAHHQWPRKVSGSTLRKAECLKKSHATVAITSKYGITRANCLQSTAARGPLSLRNSQCCEATTVQLNAPQGPPLS